MSVSPKTKRERSKNTYLQRSLLLDWVGAFGAEDIGIDLGTSNAVIYVKNKGLVFPEAAVVAKNENTKKIFAYGVRAGEMEAPIRCNSPTCINLFSKTVSVTRLKPSPMVISAINCACKSVGNPG